MKTIKIILIMFFLLLGGIVMSQTNWQISTEKYNGSEYTIKRGKYVCAVTNKKYAFEEMTLDIEKDGETAEAYAKRREPLYQKLYDVTKEALDFDNIFVLRRDNDLSMDCYFDSKTKNYVGAKFVFTEGLVSYFTIAKINALENKLMQAGINAGTSYLLDSSKKYFCIRVTCSIGKTREELMRN